VVLAWSSSEIDERDGGLSAGGEDGVACGLDSQMRAAVQGEVGVPYRP